MDAPAEPPFNLRHRATSALILLAIPIILLPWLLGGGPVSTGSSPEPALPEPTGEFNSSVGLGTGGANTETAPETTETPAALVPAQDASDETAVGEEYVSSSAQEGWVVRVGVFSESANLKKRSALLVANGMTPQQEQIEINGRTAVRLYLGPFEDVTAAERESGKAMLVTGEPAFVVELR